MSTTLSLDTTGGLFVPADLLERAHLAGGKSVTVEVEDDRLVLTGTSSSPAGNADVKLVKKGKIQVFTGLPPFDAAAAVNEVREERDAQLLSHRKS